MSKHKAAGKTRQHVRPEGKRLGVKVASGQKVLVSNILIRQRGTLFAAGKGVKVGRDHSLYATVSGTVKFGQKLGKKQVSVR
ncbi:50S ribosomal protein L27 [Candidatus Woesebacteria bacterium]|nr:50S ribosomal protein L27 [Candidatus Woesebacteria bacterium]QQG47142.1 MAG: 50S ribosomal protein L27 [Candidatus Woesebacteria bacterium]